MKKIYWSNLVKESQKPALLSGDELLKLMGAYYGNIFITDGTGKILFFNEAEWRQLGLQRDRDIGRNVADLKREGIFSKSATQIVLQEKKDIFMETHTKEGIPLWVHATPVFDDKENIIYTIHFCKRRDEFIVIKNKMESQEKKLHNLGRVMQKYNEKFDNELALVYTSKIMDETMALAKKIAAADDTALILGPTGSGKEVMARFLLANSYRKDKPFFTVNCAAIPEQLIESELFGYAPGAFTGGNRGGSDGLFTVADGGTLFLDEVGEMPLSMQAKLLRAIESGEITRVGDTKPLKVNVRIIAATNRNLEEMAELGLFRKDLLYRLNIIPIKIPSLQERKEDIPLLIDYYLNYYNKKYGTACVIPPHIQTVLTEYHWPGNVRELKNCINRIAVVGGTEEKEILPPEIYEYYMTKKDKTTVADRNTPASENHNVFLSNDLQTLVRNYETSLINNALHYFDGNITKTAEALGVHRSYLYRRLK